ncbi:ATP-grasp domain-containing protein [Macrococcus capreoli]
MLPIEDKYILLLAPKGEEIKIIESHGYKSILLSNDVTFKDKLKYDVTFKINLNSYNEVIQLIKNIKEKYDIKSAFTLNEYRVELMAIINGIIGNKNTLSIKGSGICRNKSLQRKYIANKFNPWFELINLTSDEIIDHYPVILKPLNDADSNNVYKCNNVTEFNQALENIRINCKNHIGITIGEHILVEEYLEGDEYSAEIVVQENILRFVSFTKKILPNNNHLYEIGHISNHQFSEKETQEIIDCLNEIIKLIDLDNAVIHIEFKYKDSFKLIEINCRPGGDKIVDLVYLSFGIDLNEISFRLISGLDLPYNWSGLTSKKQFAINFFYVEKDLITKDYPNIPENLKSEIIEINKTNKLNKNFKKTISNYNRYGYIISNYNEENQEKIRNLTLIGG